MGRPPGQPKSGGRQKGTADRALRMKVEMREAIRQAAILESLGGSIPNDLDPLRAIRAIMIASMRSNDLQLALSAAGDMLPFTHPRLMAIAVHDARMKSPGVLTNDELAARIARVDALLEASMTIDGQAENPGPQFEPMPRLKAPVWLETLAKDASE